MFPKTQIYDNGWVALGLPAFFKIISRFVVIKNQIMARQTSIKVRFILSSQDLRPEEVTERVGIKPTSSANKGDIIEGVKTPSPIGFWALERESEHSVYVDELIDEVVEHILPKKEKFSEVIKQFGLNSILSIVLIIENYVAPGLSLSKDNIKLLDYLSTGIDVDIYVNPPV